MNIEYEKTEAGNVRVIRGGDKATPVRPQRSVAQKRMDDILNDAEAQLRVSRDQLVLALEGMELLMTPQHKDLETRIGQLIEQVIEFRRARQ